MTPLIIIALSLLGIATVALSSWRLANALDKRSEIAVLPFLLSHSEVENGTEILNCGSGPALNVYWRLPQSQSAGFIQVIAPGKTVRIATAMECLEVNFESLSGQAYSAVLNLDGMAGICRHHQAAPTKVAIQSLPSQIQEG